MDQCTRRIVGFAVHKGTLDGTAVCRMFGRIISGTALPNRLSSDNDPLFEFHRWKANLRILEIEEIKTVPFVPMSHPFVERLIGTIRREYLDHVPFWNARDLERKLSCFQGYYNRERVHQGIGGSLPDPELDDTTRISASLDNYRWRSCCRGLCQLPIAA
jgi:transposase InsO family protein